MDSGELKDFIQNAQKENKKKAFSASRIRDFLIEVFTSESPQEALDLLDKSNLLKKWLPEVADQKGFKADPNWHADNDVYTHMRIMLGHMNKPSVEMVFSVLLHDIGKPPTQKISPDGKISYPNHAEVGAEMTEKVLKRLQFPQRQAKAIVELVQNHMDFAEALTFEKEELAVFLERPNILEELELYRYDLLGCEGPLSKKHKNGEPENYMFFLEKISSRHPTLNPTRQSHLSAMKSPF